MATYVNNLRLKEITTGDEDGTWGTSTNTNLELITDGFSYGTKQLAADANETFTMPDASADDTRSFYLKITSAVSLTATREVTLGPNTVSKVWMIENATTGSQTITIKQGSGATVDVPTGEKVMVVTDGAGAGAAVLNANPSGATGGTVTSVTGTGTVNGISLSGTVTSSGNITLGGALTGVDLTSQVTGTLPTGNGGTGSTATTYCDLTANVTGILPTANGGTGSTATTYCDLTANVTGILPTVNGGTGLSSIGTANQVLAVNSGATALEYKTFEANPTITATASGALSDGDPVVIKSDGKVSAITSTSATTGSPQDTGEAIATSDEPAAVSYDPSAGAMLISFRDDVSNKGRTIAATISGQTISYGSMTDVLVDRSVQASVYYPTENATFLCELDNAGIEVVTVSGTTVTRIAGSQFDFQNQNCYSACYDASADKVIGLGRIDVATVNKYSLQAVDLTGTIITKGSNTVSSGNLDDSGNYGRVSITHDTVKNDNTFVVSNGSGAFIETWSCSGTTLTNVSSTTFPTATSNDEIRVIYGSTSNSYLFFYQDSTNSSYITVIGATRGIGNSFSFGSPAVVASAAYADLQVGYNPAANKFLISYIGASTYRYLHEVTPSGNDLGLGSAVNISNSVAVQKNQYSNIAYDSDTEQNIIGYTISDGSVFAVVYDPSTSTLSTNTFIGFSDGAYSDTATATIQVVGSVDDAQTGLTTGKKHYVQTDGTLATAPDTPEVFAGTAISATKIITKG